MKTEKEFRVTILDDNLFYGAFVAAQLRHFVAEIAIQLHLRTLVSSYTSPVDFLRNISANTDVVILDYFLDNDHNGITVMQEVFERCEDCKVIIISQQTTISTSLLTILQGAHCFIPKDKNALVNICHAVESIMHDRKPDQAEGL